MSRAVPDMAVLLLRNRKRADELCGREGLDGRAHKSGAIARDDKVHAGTLGHRADTAILKVWLIGIGGGKTSFLVERLYRVALKTVAHYLAGARLACLFSENVVRVLERAGLNNTLYKSHVNEPLGRLRRPMLRPARQHAIEQKIGIEKCPHR